MVVDRRMMIAWLVLASLASRAIADGQDPFVALRKQAQAADSLADSSSPGDSPAPGDSSAEPVQPGSTTAGPFQAKTDPAVRPAQYYGQPSSGGEPLGFQGAHFQPAGPRAVAPRSASGWTQVGIGDAPQAIYDRPVRQVQYIAQQPHPDEPLGFHGARLQPAVTSGPPLEAGIFDEPEQECYDPFDPEAPAPKASSGEWIRGGHWYTEQSVVYMSRAVNVRNKIDLAIDLTSAPLAHYQKILDIPLDMGFQPGFRSTLGRYIGRDARNRDHSVEFTFLGMTHWRNGAELTAVTPGGIFSIVDASLATPAYNASDMQSFTQSSNFNSYELNYRISRRPTRDRMIYTRDSTWVQENTPTLLPALFGGLRVISVNERLNYLAESSVANGAYNVLTHNNMVGLQGGVDLFYERPEWRLGIRLKGGILVNWADESTQVRILDSAGTPVVPNRDEHASTDIMALLGEISFIGAYQIRPNVAFRVSYDLMWLTNMTLAQNQINFTPSTAPISANEHSLLFQGVSVGFEINR